MYVSHDRRSDITASTCPGTVVVGGWLLTMAAVTAFAFAAGDTVLNDGDAVLVSKTATSLHQTVATADAASAPAGPESAPRIVTTVVVDAPTATSGTTPAAVPGQTCGARPATTAGTVQRVSTRELATRSTTRSGASVSRIAASACRVGAAAKLTAAGVTTPAPLRSAGAVRPTRIDPAPN